MSGDRRWGKKKLPEGWDIISTVMDALDAEQKEHVSGMNTERRNVELQWPIHQINWQRSRYVYDLYYRYKRIPKGVYDYCTKQKLVDVALIAKWKKQGYERLCSTYSINNKNFNHGTVSVCRVPRYELGPDHPLVEGRFNGCRGCSTGRGGRRNIFGNKYGQYLAAIQIHREKLASASTVEPEYESIWANSETETQFDNAGIDDDDTTATNRKERRKHLQQSVPETDEQLNIDPSVAERLAALKQPARQPDDDLDDDVKARLQALKASASSPSKQKRPREFDDDENA